MKTITRKTMLYKTGVEYGDYTMNHVQGCAHGCKYPCYAFMMKKRFGQISDYNEWIQPYLVSNTLDLLDSEIPKLKKKIKSVHLCFSTDPFMYKYKEIENISLSSIQKLNNAGIKCVVLTKGLLPYKLHTFSCENEYGITLITLDEKYRKLMEPYAAPITKRIAALKKLHEAGCKTWVSIEPYPTPNFIRQDIYDLLETISFVDKIVFGKMNYNKLVSEFNDHKLFYNNSAQSVLDFCKDNGISCHIKNKTISL